MPHRLHMFPHIRRHLSCPHLVFHSYYWSIDLLLRLLNLFCAWVPPGVVLNTVPPGVVEYSWGMWAESWMAIRLTAGISRLLVVWPPADISLGRHRRGKLLQVWRTGRYEAAELRSDLRKVTSGLHVSREHPKQAWDFLQNNSRELWLAGNRGRHNTWEL